MFNSTKMKPLVWLTFVLLHMWLFFFFAKCTDSSLSMIVFYYNTFDLGSNWKLLIYKHLQGRDYISFSLDFVYSYFFQLRYPCSKHYISDKLCSCQSKLYLRRCIFAFWRKVAIKTRAFHLAIFTLLVQRREIRWLCMIQSSHLVGQSEKTSTLDFLSFHRMYWVGRDLSKDH